MKDTFFNWEEFSGEQRLYFPEEAFEEIFSKSLKKSLTNEKCCGIICLALRRGSVAQLDRATAF